MFIQGRLPKRTKPTWVTLAKDFIKEWPEVLDGLEYTNLPISYVKWIHITLKNNVTIRYDIEKALQVRSKKKIVDIVTKSLNGNYNNIKKVDLKFNVKQLKIDIEQKTDVFLKKSYQLLVNFFKTVE